MSEFGSRLHANLKSLEVRSSHGKTISNVGHLCIGDWGINQLADPNREIGFGFVSCSCRACVRAGEAKLCGCVREVCLPTLGARTATNSTPGVGGFGFCFFVANYMGFKRFSHGLLLCSWVFWSFLVFDGMLMGFLMFLHTLFAFAAMLMGLFLSLIHI